MQLEAAGAHCQLTARHDLVIVSLYVDAMSVAWQTPFTTSALWQGQAHSNPMAGTILRNQPAFFGTAEDADRADPFVAIVHGPPIVLP
jgi:hypothetical protein